MDEILRRGDVAVVEGANSFLRMTAASEGNPQPLTGAEGAAMTTAITAMRAEAEREHVEVTWEAFPRDWPIPRAVRTVPGLGQPRVVLMRAAFLRLLEQHRRRHVLDEHKRRRAEGLLPWTPPPWGLDFDRALTEYIEVYRLAVELYIPAGAPVSVRPPDYLAHRAREVGLSDVAGASFLDVVAKLDIAVARRFKLGAEEIAKRVDLEISDAVERLRVTLSLPAWPWLGEELKAQIIEGLRAHVRAEVYGEEPESGPSMDESMVAWVFEAPPPRPFEHRPGEPASETAARYKRHARREARRLEAKLPGGAPRPRGRGIHVEGAVLAFYLHKVRGRTVVNVARDRHLRLHHDGSIYDCSCYRLVGRDIDEAETILAALPT